MYSFFPYSIRRHWRQRWWLCHPGLQLHGHYLFQTVGHQGHSSRVLKPIFVSIYTGLFSNDCLKAWIKMTLMAGPPAPASSTTRAWRAGSPRSTLATPSTTWPRRTWPTRRMNTYRTCVGKIDRPRLLSNANHAFYFYSRYSVCIRSESGYCCVQYSVCPDQALGYTLDPALMPPAVDDLCLTDDYVSIPQSGPSLIAWLSRSRPCHTVLFVASRHFFSASTCNRLGAGSADVASRYCGKNLNPAGVNLDVPICGKNFMHRGPLCSPAVALRWNFPRGVIYFSDAIIYLGVCYIRRKNERWYQ